MNGQNKLRYAKNLKNEARTEGPSRRPRLGAAGRATLWVGLLFFLFLAVSPHWSASALLFNVDDSYAADNPGLRQYTTIQKAINNASNGDTVIVNAGIYTEFVVVNKTLTISGNPRNGTWVAPGSGGYSFDIQANNVSISSLTFNISEIAIYIGAPFTRLSVDSVTFESNVMGVKVDAASNVSINNSYFGNQTWGIYSLSSYGTFAGNNTFVNNQMGAAFDNTNGSVVRDGNHTNDNIAVYLYFAWRAVVDRNHLGNSTNPDAIGVYLYGSSQTVVSSNRIDNFTGDGYGNGIQVDWSYDSTVKANDLSNVTHPIAVTPYDDNSGAYYNHSILSTNLIDGRPVYYYVNTTDVVVPSGAGWIGAYNVKNLASPFQDISRAMNGIWLNTVTNAAFSGYNFSGPTPQHKGYALYVAYSTNVTFFRVNVTGETAAGYIIYSTSVTVRDGTIQAVPYWFSYAFQAYYSDRLALINNTVNLQWYGFLNTQSSAFIRIIGNRLDQASWGYHYYNDQMLFQDNIGNGTSGLIYCYGCAWGRANNNTLTNSSYPVYLDGYDMEHFQWQIAANNTWEGRIFRSFINTTNLTVPGNLSWMLITNVTNAASNYYDPSNGTYHAALITYSTNVSLRRVVANSSNSGISLREVQGVNISNYSLWYSGYGLSSFYSRDVTITNATWTNMYYEGVFAYYNTRLTVRNVTMEGSYAYAFLEDYFGEAVVLDNVTITRTSSLARAYYGTGYTFNRANQSVHEQDYFSPYIGVYAYNVSRLNITNSSFRDGETGVTFEGGSWDILLRNITIANMTGHGVFSFDAFSGNITIDGGTITGRVGYGSSQDAVHFENVGGPLTVRNLNLSLFWVGVFIGPTNNVTVQGNNISSTLEGISFSSVVNSVIRLNTINGTTTVGIRIEGSSSNITVDSNTIRNMGTYGDGMFLSGATRLNVTNNSIQTAWNGIYIDGGRDDSFSLNTINATTTSGIFVTNGHQNSTFTSNTITNSAQFGFYINRVSYLTLTSNALSGSLYNFRIDFSTIAHFHHTIGTTNTVNSKPIYFLVNQTGGSVPTTAGVAILANCSGTLVNGLTVDHNWHGVLLFNSFGITVLSVTAGTTRFGVEVRNTVNSTIQDSTINDAEIGVQLVSSTNTTLTNNVVNSSSIYGVLLSNSNVFTLTSNRISNSSFLGLYISSCSGGTFVSNQMSNDVYSFYIFAIVLAHYNHSMPASNTINGAPIFYRLNTTDVVVPANVSAVVLANVTNGAVADLFLNRTYTTIDIFGSFNITVTNITVDISGWGVHMRSSNNITVSRLFSRPDSYVNNFMVDVETQSHNITISDVNVFYGNGGLRVAGPNTANVSLTNATLGNRSLSRYVYQGVYIQNGVDNVTVSQVNFNYTYYHIYITASGGLTRVSNVTVANSSLSRFANSNLAFASSGSGGPWVENVTLYHNNLQTSGATVLDSQGLLRWYRDYPYGGNFWDNWTTPDNFNSDDGTPGGDGIVDNPFYWNFVFDAYPLADPWPPQVVLNRPSNNSVVAAGTILDFNVSRYFDAVTYAINNGSSSTFLAPFDINTSGWLDGTYHIWVNATDTTRESPSRWFVVAIDSAAPAISVVSPPASAIYGPGTQLNFSIVDPHLALNATWNNGSGAVSFSTIWNISTSGWADADYNITIVAWDTAGNRAQQTFAYGIDGVAPAITLVTPSNNSVIRGGTMIDLNVVDAHFADASWNNGSGANAFTAPFDISTSGWNDGPVTITVFANDTLGRQTMRLFNFVMDSTPPTITLNTPANNSYIQPGRILDFSVTDTNFANATWAGGGFPASSFTSPFDVSTTAWGDAVHSITIVANDLAGNFRTMSFVFTVDGTPPTITLGLPGNNSIGQSGVTMDFAVTDTNFANATWAGGGFPASSFTSPFDISTTAWGDAVHSITIVANDLAGNSRTSTFGITLDNTKPTITLNGPSTGSVIRAGTSVDLSIADVNFFYATWDNGTGAVTFSSPFDINTTGWADGAKVITIYAYDMASNFAGPYLINHTFDSTAPSISLSSPANGTVKVPGTTLDLAVTDANTFNATYNYGAGSNALSSPYDISTTGWADGAYSVTVNATDLAGNTRFFQFSVTIDSIAPTVTLASPANNSYFAAGRTLDFAVSDANLNTVIWSNGGAYSSLASPFDVSTSSWSDGAYTVRVNATDLAGNFRNVSFSFTVDSTPPTLALVSPGNSSYFAAGTTLDFSASDTNLNTVVYSNGGAWTGIGAPYDVSTTGWADGVYTVRVNASDLAGNFRNISYTFTVDSTGPTLSLVSPLNNSYFAAGTTLDFAVSDTNLNTVVWSNGSGYATLGSPYGVSTTAWADGAITVRVNATDLAGNFRNVSFSFTVDSTAPSVSLLSPLNNSYIVGGATLDFSVADTNLNSTIYSNGGAYTPLANPYDVSTTGWADGVYTVRINATDLAGNFLNTTFTVTVDSTPPAISFTSPGNNAYVPAGSTLDFTVTETYLSSTVWSNGGAYSSLSSPWDIITTGWSDNVYTVRINATDLAGNFLNTSFTFTMDSTPPVVVYNGPFGSVFWNGAIVLTAGMPLDFGVTDTNMDATTWTNGSASPSLTTPFDVATTGWADGLYTVRVNSADLAGNAASHSVLILIDSTGPSWAFASPGNNGHVVAGSLLTFDLTELHPTAADWSNGGAPVAFTAQWDNATGIVTGTLYAVSTSGWADGVYSLTLSARDAAAATVVSVYTVTVDSTAPVISLVSPANNSVIDPGVVVVIGVTELNLASATWNNGSGNTNFTSPFNISTAGWADGAYNVTVRATDRAGTLIVRVYRFVVDGMFPVIPVPSWSGTFVDAGTLLNITIIEGNPLWLNATLGLGSFSSNTATLQVTTATLADGLHTVNVTAIDRAGHLTNASFVVTIDSVLPIIQGVTPANGSFIKPGVPVSFGVVDTNLLNVTFRRNGGAQLPANGTGPYSINTSGWGNGNSTVILYARDLAGHVTTLTLVLVTDSLPPTLPSLPATQTYAEDVPVTFDASAASDGPNPLSNASVEWNFSGRLNSLVTGLVVVNTWDTPGNYTVMLTITDAAGNSNSALYSVAVLDTTPPVARAGSDASENEDVAVALDGTSSTDNDPDFAANMRFLWTQVSGPTVAFNPTADSSSFTPSQPGIYTFDLTVTDGVGLTNTDSVQFTIVDITAPVLPTISYPVFNEGATVAFNATGTTDNDGANASAITYLWTFVDGSLVEIDGITGSHQFLTPGPFTVTLTATDVSGNRATRLIALRINDIPGLATLPPFEFELPGIYEVTLDILDTDTGDSHNITVVSPSNMTIATIGTKPALRFSPGVFGIYAFNFSLSDGWSSVTFAFNLTVTTAATGNRPPVFSTEPVLEATSTRQYSYLSQATDPDGDRLVFGLDLFPPGMTINPATGAVNWPHGYTVASGDHFDNVALWVWDGAHFVYQNFTVRFLAGGNPVPTIGDGVIGNVQVKNGTTYDIGFGEFVADANDPITNLTFTVTVLDPAIASATIQGTGSAAKIVVRGLQAGTTTLTLRVRDPSGALATKPIQVTVEAVSGAPPPSSDPFGGLLLLIILAAAIAAAGMFFFVVRRRKHDERPVAQPIAPEGGVEVAAQVITAPTTVVRAPASSVALSAASAAAVVAAAAVAPEKKITYTIEGLFVIYKDGRLLYSKTDMGASKFEDPELVSSMFTAVQSFIKDSFQAEGELNKMGYGDNHVIIERGNHIFVAAIVYGDPDAEFTETLRGAIEGMELSYAGVIEAWDGQMDRFSDMDQKLAPVAALTAGITRREVQLATTKQEVLMLSELEFFQGFVRLKVGIKNNTASVITKATVDIEYNEDVLRLGRVEPAAYRTSGAKVLLGVLNPGEKSSVAYYFDPQICTESQIDGVCRYRDASGVLHSVSMKTRKAEVVCPLFFTKEHANTAMLKRLVESELNEKDAKIFEIQKMPPYIKFKDVFDLVKSVVNAHDVQQVREFTKYNTFQGEAWFYGETKVKGYKMVIRTSVIEETNAIEFFAASTNMKAITGLLAEFNHTLSSMIIEKYSDLKIALTFDPEKKAEIDKKSLMSNMSSAELEGGETDQPGGDKSGGA